ncbi:MAG: glycosyltransferase family 4 protein [Clostridiales bacterium]|nr:glycosyltransferase family 4 protein [Clostridiales bacterium]
MKKVLIIATVSGFLFQFEQENVRILQSLGYEVHYAANAETENYLFDSREIERLRIRMHPVPIPKSPMKLLAIRRALRMIISLIREEGISLIHCHTPVGGVLGRIAGRSCRDMNVRVIYTAHGFHFFEGAPVPGKWLYHMIEQKMAHDTDALVVINREDYQNALKFRLKKDGMVYRIPGVGLDTERFRPLTEEQCREARGKLNLSEEDFFLVFVGELNENKNPFVLLRALALLKNSDYAGRRIICGICGDGAAREKLTRQIAEMQLSDAVKMYGYCSPVAPVLGCADAMIFPSRREGLGMAALEALAMGIPVIAADNRGTREYMEHQKNGWVCEPDDVQGYADGIRFVEGLDTASREEMKRACRACVQRSSKDKTAEIMSRVYKVLDDKISAEM